MGPRTVLGPPLELESGWRALIRSGFRHGTQPTARAFPRVEPEMQTSALVKGTVRGQDSPIRTTKPRPYEIDMLVQEEPETRYPFPEER